MTKSNLDPKLINDKSYLLEYYESGNEELYEYLDRFVILVEPNYKLP